MAKDTSTSRCPRSESGCNHLGSVVRFDKFKTNSGFKFDFTVDLTGFSLSDNELIILGCSLRSHLKKALDAYVLLRQSDFDQPELF